MVTRPDDNVHLGDTGAGVKQVQAALVAQGYTIADQIHRSGLAMVWSGHQELAEHYWEQLRDAGLTMAPLEQG